MDDGVHSLGVSVSGGGVVWFLSFLCVAFPIMDRGWDDPGSPRACL